MLAYCLFLLADRPRVKNYYRNAQIGFWNGLIPQLHANGREGVPVPEVGLKLCIKNFFNYN